MATNTGTGSRKGSVTSRTQTFNPKTKDFVKRNAETGKFMAAKATPYKGVAKERDRRRT
jgi:hypothetical protein